MAFRSTATVMCGWLQFSWHVLLCALQDHPLAKVEEPLAKAEEQSTSQCFGKKESQEQQTGQRLPSKQQAHAWFKTHAVMDGQEELV